MSANFGHAYLTILDWGAVKDEQQRVEALVLASAMDPTRARTMARAPTPAIVQRIDPLIRDEILSVLHERGVLALAPSEDEMEILPDAEPVKRVLRFPDTRPASFAVDDNDEDAWTFTSDNIRLIVFGTVIEKRTKTVTDNSGEMPQSRRVVSREQRDLMDLYLTHQGRPRLLRLKEPRTLIRSLTQAHVTPSLRDPPDPVELIRPYVGETLIDQSFSDFESPRAIIAATSKFGRVKHALSSDAFGFYSCWKRVIQKTLYD